MNLKSKWSIIAGTVLVSGALLTTGVVFAATGSATETAPAAAAAATAQPSAQSHADHLDAAVKSGQITQAEADVMKQLDDLHKAAMDKLKADSQAVIDQAVRDGKITQDQATQLASHDGHMGGHDGGHGFGHKGGRGWQKDGKQDSKSTQGATGSQTNNQ